VKPKRPTPQQRGSGQRRPSRLAIRPDRIDAQGTLGVICAGVVALARHRVWLGVLALLVLVALVLGLAALAPGLLGRVVALL